MPLLLYGFGVTLNLTGISWVGYGLTLGFLVSTQLTVRGNWLQSVIPLLGLGYSDRCLFKFGKIIFDASTLSSVNPIDRQHLLEIVIKPHLNSNSTRNPLSVIKKLLY